MQHEVCFESRGKRSSWTEGVGGMGWEAAMPTHHMVTAPCHTNQLHGCAAAVHPPVSILPWLFFSPPLPLPNVPNPSLCLLPGTHHAFRDYGSGYCILNDLAVTAAALTCSTVHPTAPDPPLPSPSTSPAVPSLAQAFSSQSVPPAASLPSVLPAAASLPAAPAPAIAAAEGKKQDLWRELLAGAEDREGERVVKRVQRVAIVDLDVHQGDGTAAMLATCPNVFTFSMHCGANFPARKQRSDLDVDVPEGTGDAHYLALLADHLSSVLTSFRPDLVLYDAGVDPHMDDALGKLCLTDQGLFRRDMQVIDTCVGMGIPVAAYVGGGYHRNVQVLAHRHCLLHRAAAEAWQDNGL
ncbi:hypothetical protein CLOM_g22474 [Closterium sp. NIES-68]|nr:hypothetical protein CLOM_g22474 [Closterium sp. NIES-68]GJP81282.1 hypothetical protein CLOP_g11440 [Closterium sp. NIES-67]